MKIGIICAFGDEGRLILQDMESMKVTKWLKMPFYDGRLDGRDVVMVISGVGKVSSALCTQILIDKYQVDVVIFAGIAGGVNRELEIGDTVIATDTMYHDVDRFEEGIDESSPYSIFRRCFSVEGELLVKVKTGINQKSYPVPSALQNLRTRGKSELQVIFGRVLTGDQVITSKERVEQLRTVLQGDCVEMEGAAVGQTCVMNDVPFMLIRTLSDLADEDALAIYDQSSESVLDINYQILKDVINLINPT